MTGIGQAILDLIGTAARSVRAGLQQEAIDRRETPIYYQLRQEQRARAVERMRAGR